MLQCVCADSVLVVEVAPVNVVDAVKTAQAEDDAIDFGGRRRRSARGIWAIVVVIGIESAQWVIPRLERGVSREQSAQYGRDRVLERSSASRVERRIWFRVLGLLHLLLRHLQLHLHLDLRRRQLDVRRVGVRRRARAGAARATRTCVPTKRAGR